MPPSLAELDVSRVLDDTLQLLEPQLRGNQIEIVRGYDPESPLVIGNSGKLQQVFTNLLLNARDALPPEARSEFPRSLLMTTH